MRYLALGAEHQTRFPSDSYKTLPDFGSPLVDGLCSCYLPSGLDPRASDNLFCFNGKRQTVPNEASAAYYIRRTQLAAAPSGLTIPTGAGGNIATPFGNAFAYSNEQVGVSTGALGHCPAYSGDGTNKAVTLCVWFRINRMLASGLPTLLNTNYISNWWLGLRTATGKYKAIFRTAASPYGVFEWGSYSADLRKVVCVTFVYPFDANKTASVYHNGVLAVQGTLANASGSSGLWDVHPLSSAVSGQQMFAEIFGFAVWTRALYAEEIRELASGPWVLLAKQQRFWYAPWLAYRNAEIAGESSCDTTRVLGRLRAAEIYGHSSAESIWASGVPRTAEISGVGRMRVESRPPATPERTFPIRREIRSMSPPAESRLLTVPGENRSIDA